MDSDSDPEMHLYNPESGQYLVSPFSYQDPLMTPLISQVIMMKNFDEIKRHLESSKSVNNPDNNGNIPLHLAVLTDRVEIVDLLLERSHVNHKNYQGLTPLLLALLYNICEEIIMHLIDAGADIYAKSTMNETVLHMSVRGPNVKITEDFIKRGLDINAQDDNLYTPLIQAVQSNNLDAVCLLLYYNADVNICCRHNLTPFMYAVNTDENYEIAKALFLYYDDFVSTTCDGYSPLLLAANSKSPIALELVNYGADVNFYTSDGYTSLYLSIFYEDSELFKEIWNRIDYEKILQFNSRFVHNFLNNSKLSPSSWLECLYLILNSEMGEIIMDISGLNFRSKKRMATSLYTLFRAFHKRGIAANDRITILYTFLSYGYIVTLCDVTVIYNLYGYNEELNILMYHLDNLENTQLGFKCHLLPTFIFGLEKDYSPSFIVTLIENQLKTFHLYCNKSTAQMMIFRCLQFFSLPFLEKQYLLNQIHYLDQPLADNIITTPEVPSLIEICRNKLRLHLRNVCKFNKPYQIYNSIKQLNVSKVLKDILLFKQTIY
ncbi:hypothetical protein FQA39_LY08399 [Lamprigera yunnana]|nr:hypothetical protein FQA39_LY08399 [Lamprigera yunnana]